jgi:hypothetical protein
MNKRIILTGVIIIITLVVLYYIGLFSILNNPLNNLVAGEPDRTCSVDSDCVVKTIQCSSTCDKEAVNVEWSKFCPFKENVFIAISGCSGPIDAKCVEGICISELDYIKSIRLQSQHPK